MSGNLDPASARHGPQSIEHKIQQHLFKTVAVGGEPYSMQVVAQTQFDARLPRHRHQESARPVEQLAEVGGPALRRRQAMKVQDIVDGRSQCAQSSLHLLNPLPALRRQPRPSQQSGKQFQTAQRIADFMRQNRRHLRQRLLTAQFVPLFD
jgi:hypothetical protein